MGQFVVSELVVSAVLLSRGVLLPFAWLSIQAHGLDQQFGMAGIVRGDEASEVPEVSGAA